MTITKEYIEGSLRNLQKQRAEALQMAERCTGALEAFELLLQRLAEPEAPPAPAFVPDQEE